MSKFKEFVERFRRNITGTINKNPNMEFYKKLSTVCAESCIQGFIIGFCATTAKIIGCEYHHFACQQK
jgi:hypothetical protein